MDPQQQTSDVGLEALEQELREAINGEPSAFFVPRVRARVRRESRQGAWWPEPRRMFGVFGAIGFVLLITGVAVTRLPGSQQLQVVRGAAPSGQVHGGPPDPTPEPTAATAESGVQAAMVREPSTRPSVLASTRSFRASRPMTAPTATDTDRDAIARTWLTAVDRGLLTAVVASPQASSPAPEVQFIPIVIPAVTIAPVTIDPMTSFTQ